MPHFLALDQSTSASKALLFSEKGDVVDRVSKEHAQVYPKPGWVEHNAEEIWRNCLDVLGEILERNGELAREIPFLSITNQRETVVVFDKATGRPLYNALVWQCRRGGALCSEAVAEGYGSEVERKTGLTIDPYFSASKMKWLMDNEPEIAAQVERGEALFGTIDTYLIYRLTEGRVYATDTTNASRTLLFDIGKMRWDEDLCELWGVPLGALPEARDSEAQFGETNLGGKLWRPLAICGVMGDSQAAMFAQGCYEKGSGKVTFGTGSSILLNIGSEMQMADGGLVTTLAWTRGGKPTYALEGILISTGATLAWLKNKLGLFEDNAELEEVGDALEDNGGVYLVPAFTGLGFPYWRAEARASIVRLSSHSGRQQVMRAGVESIAYQVHDAVAAMKDASRISFSSLKADGGSTSNAFLMQLVADLCSLEISVSSVEECSALGATLAGMLGMRMLERPEDFQAVAASSQRYLSVMEPSRREQLLSGWNRAVEQTLFQNENARIDRKVPQEV
ncbi:glycerol kinase GlpK [Pelagicoccus sp. SDUM812002]|uniref:FGGY-family carbohydrate kinase n=1 Tax=Pelagicoccus sp. SDUM812002 TaxID=3041266 RepID=UPI00280E3BC6|nr:glycerol kinase GlpK [Pelagicoccus sp. SDUM812002]MDQ8187660.1 glycerol kinase GlpK [Pelagicoccus sp. SDUM812002]